MLSLPAYAEIFLKRRFEALKGEARREELDRGAREYLKQMDPAIGVSQGDIDEVIDPSQTRTKLIEAFRDSGLL